MKKILFALIIISLVSCTASRVEKAKQKIYKKEHANVERYFREYNHGKISARELQTLVLGSFDYIEYFVAPVKNKKLLK